MREESDGSLKNRGFYYKVASVDFLGDIALPTYPAIYAALKNNKWITGVPETFVDPCFDHDDLMQRAESIDKTFRVDNDELDLFTDGSEMDAVAATVGKETVQRIITCESSSSEEEEPPESPLTPQPKAARFSFDD